VNTPTLRDPRLLDPEDEIVLSAESGAQGALTTISREERSRRTAALLAEAAWAAPERRAQLLDAVVVLNCRVADAVAARFRHRGVSLEDLRQTAYEGLIKAVQRYDPDTSEDLLTYAVPVIRGEVQRHLRDRAWLVRPPRHVHEVDSRIRAAVAHLVEDFGREPTAGEVCDYLGLAEEDYLYAHAAMTHLRHDSLDRQVGPDPTSATVADLIETGADDNALSRVEARTVLAPALRRLNERDRRIVYLRFFEERTQRQIGDELGLKQAQVGRTIDRILRDLRRAVESTDDDPSR
jgi:RNA polymerase sigma-B factor